MTDDLCHVISKRICLNEPIAIMLLPWFNWSTNPRECWQCLKFFTYGIKGYLVDQQTASSYLCRCLQRSRRSWVNLRLTNNLTW
jgi:hypothetical protein